MLPKWSDIKQLTQELIKVRPKHVVALLRAAKDDPSLKKALKKTRTRVLLGLAIGLAGTITIIKLTPPVLAALAIGLGSKAVSLAFAGSAFKETLHAVREHKDEILSYLPGRTSAPPVNDNTPAAPGNDNKPERKLPDNIKNRFSDAQAPGKDPQKKKTASRRRRKPGGSGPTS